MRSGVLIRRRASTGIGCAAHRHAREPRAQGPQARGTAEGDPGIAGRSRFLRQ